MSAPSKPTSGLARLAPALVPAYVAGLVLVYAGERIFSGIDAARVALTGLGALLAFASTVARLLGSAGADPERRRVERLLSACSFAGVLALVVYLATSTDRGRALLHIASASAETKARIDAVATIGWIALFVLSVPPLLFGERALAPMRRAPGIEARRVVAAVTAGLTLGLAALYTGLFTYAAGELEVKLDFSYYRTARPGESTRKIAASLTDPVTVTAFFPALNDVGLEVEGYLRDLAKKAPGLRVEQKDRLLAPAAAKEAKVTSDGVLVLSRGSSRETLMIGIDPKFAASKLKTLDADFQKALLKVLRSQRVAYLTVGHGEMNEATGSPESLEGRTTKGLRRLLESQNYAVKDLGLAQGLGSEIPSDAAIVFAVGPTKAFLPEEVTALSRFADRGGKLFLALDPDAKIDLQPLAAMVDLEWRPAVLANDKAPYHVRRRNNDSDRTILVTNRFSSHASVTTLSRNSTRAAVIFPGAAALEKKAGAASAVDFAIRSLESTFDDENQNFQFDGEPEKRGVYNLAAAVSRTSPKGKDDKGADAGMRAFVLGDADVVSDAALGNESNVVLLLDAVRWLGGEESFAGTIESSEDVRIEHTKQKDLVWFYSIIFGAPALVLGAGLFVGRRKRRPSAPDPAPRERARSKDEKDEKAATKDEDDAPEGRVS